MLRKSFVLVFIHFRVKARQHDRGFKNALANHRTDQLTYRSTVPLIQSPLQKLLIITKKLTILLFCSIFSTRSIYMTKKYTAIVRKSKLEYVAVCLELNVSARGVDLADVENNLRSAIELYLQDIDEYPDTVVSPISIEELIEFLQDTEPEWHRQAEEDSLLRPFEVHEVPAYA
jgi:predicted RNase H-like HicB family nuclease